MGHLFKLLSLQGDPEERLARIETKVDMILAMSKDHETRLRTLEDRQGDLERKQQTPLRAYAVPLTLLCTVVSAAVALWAILN